MNTRMVLSLAAASLLLLAPFALAQNPIPNPGFENWSNDTLIGWYTSNDGVPGSVYQTTEKHSGSWAVRGDVVDVGFGFFAGPMIMSGDMQEGFLTNKQWASISGYYKFNSVSGDQLLFSVSFTSSDSGTVGGGALLLPATGSSLVAFNIPIFWSGSALPDTGYILAFVNGASGQLPHLGTHFIFDDLTLSESAPPVCSVTLTGDCDHNGTRATSDIIYLVNHVLKGGPVPLPCRGVGDVDCSGALATSDIIYLVNAVLKGGPSPCDVCTIIPGSWACP